MLVTVTEIFIILIKEWKLSLFIYCRLCEISTASVFEGQGLPSNRVADSLDPLVFYLCLSVEFNFDTSSWLVSIAFV